MIGLFCKVNKVLKDSSDFRNLCRSNTWNSLLGAYLSEVLPGVCNLITRRTMHAGVASTEWTQQNFWVCVPHSTRHVIFWRWRVGSTTSSVRIFGSSCWQLVVPKESILLHDPQILYIWVWLVGLALGHLVIKIVLHVSFCKHLNTCNKFAGLESYLDVSTREKIWCDHQFTCVQVL